MKKSIGLIIGLCLLVVWGCTTDEGAIRETEAIPSISKSTSSVPVPDIVGNQIVVKFDETLSTTRKDTIRILLQAAQNFVIQHIEVCDCDPNGPELWTIDTTQIGSPRVETLIGSIEEVVGNLDNNSSESDLEADLQFYFNIDDDQLSGMYASSINDKIISNSNPDIINIAILDTGIDYSYFPGQFLYNTSSTNNGVTDISGWDFINHDKDIRDDHGHGTTVAKVIISELDATNTPHAILAVKAFDKTGRTSYYDTICGVNYISKLTDIHILNMSFGWYMIERQSILENMMKSLENTTLIITSAGNFGVDTDELENSHFPSGYEVDNMIAVGGYELESDLPDHSTSTDVLNRIIIRNSNFGKEHIDFVAPFDGYELTFNSQGGLIETVHPRGTSFSAAYAAARAAQLHDRGVSVSTLKQTILSSAYRLQRMEQYINNGNVIVRNHLNQTP
ncbi:S8 family serine peptidase [Aquimarina algiphila]|uniref:S8 family serine peptidase n=1 Tax=Aquimarina algiphila TaxID=2047982 RepID=UPI0023311A38|nr:S8 family serine peptidase [Aquimarina algiphila]